MNTSILNALNIVGFRIFNPSDALPFLPAQNHIGSLLLFQLVHAALKTRGLLVNAELLPGFTTGELNRSNYLLVVNQLGEALTVIEDTLSATTLRPMATPVYWDRAEECWRTHGHNGANIVITDEFTMVEMESQQARLMALIDEVKKLRGAPPPPEPPATDQP